MTIETIWYPLVDIYPDTNLYPGRRNTYPLNVTIELKQSFSVTLSIGGT